MKLQRGFTLPTMGYLFAAIGVIVGLAFLLMQWKDYVGEIDQNGYDRGVSETKEKYVTRDNQALLDAYAERDALQAMLNSASKRADEDQRKSADDYRKGLANAKNQYDADVAAIRAGTLVLRDPGKTWPFSGGSQAANGNGATGTSGRGSCGPGDNQLSAESSGMVLWLAGEAQRLADKSNRLYKITQEDRAIIDAFNKENVR